MQRKLIVFTVLLALSPAALAWDNESYAATSRRLCVDFGCGCESFIVDGSLAPDLKFRDTATHHCYKPDLDFSQYAAGTWQKPVLNECPALDKAAVWLTQAGKDAGCKRWYDFGVSLHYFLDSKEFWNNVISVNQSCVSEQESEVSDYLRFGGSAWKSCQCGICVTNEDFVDWLAEFRERVKPMVFAPPQNSPTAVIISNSLDRAAAEEAGKYLTSRNITVTQAAPTDFAKHKNSPLIVILGGQNAPEVGTIVDSLFTDGDRSAVMKAVFTGAIIKKADIWVSDQTVYFLAGYGANETADAAWAAKDKIAESAYQLTKPKNEASPECAANDDCGTPYYGPYVCSNRKQAARVLYTPICQRGTCSERGGRPSTVGCGGEEVCFSFRGCVPKGQIATFEGIYRPLFASWLSADRVSVLEGNPARVVLNVRSYVNATMSCQYYDGEWKDMGSLNATVSDTITVALNMTTNQTGRFDYTERIRCGNLSDNSTGELKVAYYAEHNFTLISVPPPLTFTISLTPEAVSLGSCLDRKNVTLRIENLCTNNITCQYAVGNLRGGVRILAVGQKYNVTGKSFVVSLTNTTYSYLDYYSGADFTNVSSTIIDENDTEITIIRNYSEEEAAYADQPKNLTIFTPTIIKISNITYEWDYPHWWDQVITVNSRECTVDRIPVTVYCTDKYGQASTLKKTIQLNLQRP